MKRPVYRGKTKIIIKRMIFYCILIAILSLITFPLTWALVSSLKPTYEIISSTPTLLPKEITFRNYEMVLAYTHFLTYFQNSVIVTSSTTILVTIASTFGGYSLARIRFKGRELMATIVLSFYMFPSILFVVPFIIILTNIGLYNTYLGLILIYTTFTFPFCLWLMRGFFLSIPMEIEEAAMIDGASRLRAFLHVVLPLTKPGVISAAIFTFILSWNEFLFALTMTNTDSMRTLPIGVAMMQEFLYTDYGLLMATAVLIILPVLIAFMFLQKHLMQGITAGAVKG